MFEFADKFRGRYDESVRVVKSYYPSASGYKDELLWAALWLHRATGRREYLDYVVENAVEFGGTGWAVSEFSWDIKYPGLQVLASKVLSPFLNTYSKLHRFGWLNNCVYILVKKKLAACIAPGRIHACTPCPPGLTGQNSLPSYFSAASSD